MHNRRRILFAIVCVATAAASGRAQTPGRVSVTLTGGPGTGWTNAEYRGGRSASTVDAMLSARVGRAAGGRVIAGVGAGFHTVGATTLECLAEPSGECRPSFPEIATLGLLGGWESTGGKVRLMAGPTMSLVNGMDPTAGLETRFDLAGRLFWRLAGVASVKSQLVHSFRGHAVGLLSAGLGIRLQ